MATVVSDDGRYEWDSDKDEANFRKHGIHFLEAKKIFRDPYLLVGYDIEHSQCEDRYYGVGCIEGFLVLVVFFTERSGRTRIISARGADKELKEAYNDSIRKINA